MMSKVCCFIGHRKIDETEELAVKLSHIIEKLITDERTDTFLFGSQSRFNRLCYEIVSEYKEKYPHIQRVYIRAEYPCISESYKEILLKEYEDTYYPDSIIGAGKAAYLERNEEMIKKSDLCVIYYRRSMDLETRRSGTKIALEYAVKHNKRIISV